MADKMIVGISDMKIVKTPDLLITYALGSCVGICLYDPVIKIAGMAHILLPDSEAFPNDKNMLKFADTSLEMMLKEMVFSGSAKSRIVAKIAGGAQLFAHDSKNENMRIGDRNVKAVKKKLNELNIRLISEDTGLNYGRTLEFHAVDGMVKISSALKGVKIL